MYRPATSFGASITPARALRIGCVRRRPGSIGSACLTLIAAAVAAAPAAAQHNESMSVGHPSRASRARQEVRAVRLLPGLQLGGVQPTGELGDVYNTGVRAGATVTAIVPTRPYGLRAALTYDRLAGGSIAPPGGTLVDVDAASMVSLTVSGLYSERVERNALLYFTAGVGVHRLDAESAEALVPDDDEPTDDPDILPPESGAETKFGASVGGGLTFRLGGLPSYLEVKAVKLFGVDAVLVPVVVGVQLGR